MEQRGGADALGVALQLSAAGELGVFELLKCGEKCSEVPIDQDRVGERSEVLGGRQFRGIGRQKQQVHMVGHAQA